MCAVMGFGGNNRTYAIPNFATLPNFDIIHDMRTKAQNAVALSLAIAGALAVPLRSDAFSGKDLPPPHCRVASYAQPKCLSNAFYMTAQPCAANFVTSA